MNINIKRIAIEVTRDCNWICKDFCMRGPSQKVNISKEDVDLILNMINKENVTVNAIVFSGGEPTLNEDMIVYIIDKIINDKIHVNSIEMVTNGHILSPKIIDAFTKFNLYKKEELKDEIEQMIQFAKEYSMESEIPYMTNFSLIAISRNKYHKPLTEEQISSYQSACKDIFLDWKDSNDEDILKTGLAKTGKPYTYEVDPIKFLISNNTINVYNAFYLTATGFLTTNGDGEYIDMDINNLGHIKQTDLIDLINTEVENKINESRENTDKPKNKKMFIKRLLRR